MNNVTWYRDTITKEELANLPSETFNGRIYVITTINDAEKAIAELRKQSIIGFDTETKPSHKKGDSHNISLIQLCANDFCFLFRVKNEPQILKLVLSILEDETILKIGLSLKDDFRGLSINDNFSPKNFIELQSYVKEFGIKDNGLSRIYANLFDKRISKKQRLSNWLKFITASQLHESKLGFPSIKSALSLPNHSGLFPRYSWLFLCQKIL